MKTSHTRLQEIMLQLEKYISITKKCQQITQQCKNFNFQSASYTDAVVKAHIPFTHHHILQCDHTGLKYTFEDHDITLIIPEGAVAKDKSFTSSLMQLCMVILSFQRMFVLFHLLSDFACWRKALY